MEERRTMRERRAKVGELLQTDVTPFDWFTLGVSYALHGFQDDATGDIPGLYLCEHECLQGYFEAFRAVLHGYGVPEALYVDRIGIYFVNTKKPENRSIEEQLAGKTLDKTQFGLIAETLGCCLISTGSPQARGRIERLWETLQSRLPVWFALNGKGQYRPPAFHQGVQSAFPSGTGLPGRYRLRAFRQTSTLTPSWPPGTTARPIPAVVSRFRITFFRLTAPNHQSGKISCSCSAKKSVSKRITTKRTTM
jgi:hypothetical protein